MDRLDKRTHRRAIGLALVACLAYVQLLWWLVHTTTPPPKLLAALGELGPFSIVCWAAWRMLHSDELERRTHLIGLGTAAVTVSLFGLVGGFLVSAEMLPPFAAGVMLQFVFPLALLTYVAVRWWVAWQYGSIVHDEGSYTHPLHHVLLGAAGLLAVALAVVTAWAYLTNTNDITNGNKIQLGLLTGITAVVALAGSFAAVRRRIRRRGRYE